ncbi:SCP-like extracellular [Altererythrobacter indicus]|uniref:SCP-like extracellular n=1 Tax=Altericroceibacterium indicum TaxID=374177 RepID=A0A845A4J5_9SPHN|nr:CAP domain-containing protein [Altericroceibacterium indicum]MXP25212.1 SCP-like extracellular [Altericroceibacterium indicum]
MNIARFLMISLASAAIFFAAPSIAQQDDGGFKKDLLSGHNNERKRVGLPPLLWSDRLAFDAYQWAQQLAADGQLRHSSSRQRGNAGENLWAGTIGYYRMSDAMDAFLSERSDFKSGVFPDVSRSGNWQDVGHYTQIIWPETKEVGCALARGRSFDFLVCRYWPAGNIVGERISN